MDKKYQRFAIKQFDGSMFLNKGNLSFLPKTFTSHKKAFKHLKKYGSIPIYNVLYAWEIVSV